MTSMVDKVEKSLIDSITAQVGHPPVKYAGSDGVQHVLSIGKLARASIEAMKNPSDALLLAPGLPYQVREVVVVPKKKGIQLRREAWNKIIDAALKEKG